MKINQLFKANIPEEFLVSVSVCYGIHNFKDDYHFSKNDLIRLKTVVKLTEFKTELYQYYLPCKAKLYVNDLNESKAITILRQMLRLFNMVLLSKQKYVKHKKTTLYYISKLDEIEEDIHSMKVDNHIVTLDFS